MRKLILQSLVAPLHHYVRLQTDDEEWHALKYDILSAFEHYILNM